MRAADSIPSIRDDQAIAAELVQKVPNQRCDYGDGCPRFRTTA